jgi:hypothetical protein
MNLLGLFCSLDECDFNSDTVHYILLCVRDKQVSKLLADLRLRPNVNFNILNLIGAESHSGVPWLHQLGLGRNNLEINIAVNFVMIPDSGLLIDIELYRQLLVHGRNRWRACKDHQPRVDQLTGLCVQGVHCHFLLLWGEHARAHLDEVVRVRVHGEFVVAVVFRQEYLVWVTGEHFDHFCTSCRRKNQTQGVVDSNSRLGIYTAKRSYFKLEAGDRLTHVLVIVDKDHHVVDSESLAGF